MKNKALEVFKEFKNILLENIVLLDTDLQRLNIIEKALTTKSKKEQAFEFLTKNFKVMVGVDKGKDLDCACLLLSAKEIDKIFELAIAYKQQDLETYNQLLNLKEVLENDSTKE